MNDRRAWMLLLSHVPVVLIYTPYTPYTPLHLLVWSQPSIAGDLLTPSKSVPYLADEFQRRRNIHSGPPLCKHARG